MSNVIDRELIGEVYSQDREIGLQLYAIKDNPYGKSMRVESSWPMTLPSEGRYFTLLNQLMGNAQGLKPEGSFEEDLAILVGPNGNNDFSKIINTNSELVRRLGYRYSEDEVESNGRTTQTVLFEYPSVPTLNDRLGETFPDSTMKFIEFPGGSYPPLDFMRAFILRGEVMVGRDQPYAYHDHAALHVLGYIGLGGRFMDYLRRTLTPFLERAESEFMLPRIPTIDNPRVATFFQPSVRFLEHVMTGLDQFSNRIPADLLIENESERLPQTVRGFFCLSDYGEKIPNSIIAEPNPLEIQRMAIDIEERYRKLQQSI